MSLRSAFKTNRNKEVDGFWFEDTGVINKDGTTPGFLLARASQSNPKFAKAAEQVGKKLKRKIENDLVSNDEAKSINMALFLDTVLLDWRNVQLEDDGVNFPFTRGNADALFLELPDLYEILDTEAKRASNFRDAEVEDDAKN